MKEAEDQDLDHAHVCRECGAEWACCDPNCGALTAPLCDLCIARREGVATK